MKIIVSDTSASRVISLRRLLLRLELAFERGEIALRQRLRGQLGADVGDHL
jgi:hypothetical protein